MVTVSPPHSCRWEGRPVRPEPTRLGSVAAPLCYLRPAVCPVKVLIPGFTVQQVPQVAAREPLTAQKSSPFVDRKAKAPHWWWTCLVKSSTQ